MKKEITGGILARKINISVVVTNRGEKSTKLLYKPRIRTDVACSTFITQKNKHSHPQDEQETERHHIRSKKMPMQQAKADRK